MTYNITLGRSMAVSGQFHGSFHIKKLEQQTNATPTIN